MRKPLTALGLARSEAHREHRAFVPLTKEALDLSVAGKLIEKESILRTKMRAGKSGEIRNRGRGKGPR